jgi:hypothetical protein
MEVMQEAGIVAKDTIQVLTKKEVMDIDRLQGFDTLKNGKMAN